MPPVAGDRTVCVLVRGRLLKQKPSTTVFCLLIQMPVNNSSKQEVTQVEWATQLSTLEQESIEASTATLALGLQRLLTLIYSLPLEIRGLGGDPFWLRGRGDAESKTMRIYRNRGLRLVSAWFKVSLLLAVCFLLTACNSSWATQKSNSRDAIRGLTTQTAPTKEIPEQLAHVQLLSRSHWVVADFQSIWKTSDGGVTWKRTLGLLLDKKPVAKIGGLNFVNQEIGFAVFDSKVFGTVDGGDSWAQISDPGFATRNIYFTDVKNGWGVGSDWADDPVKSRKVLYVGKVWRTQDGGKTWREQPLPQTYMDSHSDRWELKDVYFLNARTGWAVGNGVLLRTDDSGETWKELDRHEDFTRITFDSRDLGWALIRESGSFELTADGGRSWKLIANLKQNTDARICFVTPDIGFAIENSLWFVATSDGGENWEPANIPNDLLAPLKTVNHVDNYIGRAKEGTLIALWLTRPPNSVIAITSTDHGKTWSRNP